MKALLVIDMQEALCRPQPQPAEIQNVINNINKLTTAMRSAKYPVFFIQHETDWGSLTKFSAGWKLMKEVKVEERDNIIYKTTPDAFHSTSLHEILLAKGVKQLIICGYASEFCVDTSVRRAAALGYDIILANDAHTTHDKPHASAQMICAHENATLPELTSFGTKIRAVSTTQLIS